jgi:acetylornithine deacetylase/succinyl-diaminopimelate desuccinylase-like protein
MYSNNELTPEQKNDLSVRVAHQIDQQIKEDSEYIVDRLVRLIKQQSISLTGRDCTAMAALLQREFAWANIKKILADDKLHIQLFDELDHRRPILFGSIHDTSTPIHDTSIPLKDAYNEKPTLLFMGHFDTQPVEEMLWRYNPFMGIVAEDRIYGRGALDTKGQLAAFIGALEILDELKIPFWKYMNLHWFFNSDEEIGGGGHSIPFSVQHAELLQADAAINMECTDERLILGCKGIMTLKVSAQTSGTIHSGKSMFLADHPIIVLSDFLSDIRIGQKITLPGLISINPKAKLVDRIDPFTDYGQEADKDEQGNLRPQILVSRDGLLKALPEGVLFHLDESQMEFYADLYAGISVNVNSIHSGPHVATTIVPQSAVTTLDIRMPYGITIQSIIDSITSVLDKYPSIRLDVTLPDPDYPEFFPKYSGVYTSPNAPIVQHAWKACRLHNIDPVIAPFATGSSDERLLPKGVPHVKFGAKGANNHGVDEYIEMPSFLRVLAIYAQLIFDFAQFYSKAPLLPQNDPI